MNKQLKKFKFIVMDADGTIFDSVAMYTKVFVMIVSRFGVPEEIAKNYYKETQGKPIKEQFSEVIRKNTTQTIKSIDIDILVDEFFESVETVPVKIFDDARKLLNWCRTDRKICFMTSGSNTNILIDRLNKAGFSDVFSIVLGSDKVSKGIGHFKIFAESQSISLNEFASMACMIGDGSGDMIFGKKAGLFPIGIVRDKNQVVVEKMEALGARQIIHSLSELMTLS